MLNERLVASDHANTADTITYSAIGAKAGTLDVRVYWNQPCQKDVTSCEEDYQLWPGVGSPPSEEGIDIPFILKAQQATPGSNNRWPIFVVVHPTADTPCEQTKYTLQVAVKHKTSFY